MRIVPKSFCSGKVIFQDVNGYTLEDVIFLLENREFSEFRFNSDKGYALIDSEAGEMQIEYKGSDNVIPEETVRRMLDVLENLQEYLKKAYDRLLKLNLENDERVQKLIDAFVASGRYVCAICAAPSILLHKGLLRDEHFVCFPGFENGHVPAHAKAVRDGKFITGKGLGAAFEFAYEIITVLIGEDKAKEVLDKIQY